MIIKSYAKINIALNVLGKSENGMHKIDMIMLPVELHDSLEITELKLNSDNYVTLADFTGGGFKYNLATEALNRILEVGGRKNRFRIVINKNIPISAGLGGGSSNAAAVLTGIRQMLRLPISDSALNELAFELGSDVPFFIYKTPARVTGFGEKVEKISVKNDYYVLIVKPTKGLSTEKVYQKSDEYNLEVTDIDAVISALKEGDDGKLEPLMSNALEKPAFDLLPEVRILKNELKSMGLKLVLMSGSGSAVFAMSKDKKILQKAYQKFENKYDVELTKVLKGENK
ncbi:MAG: 4-(cytidine 5'-diphospho)-2-C-methyl-D-erythritol kinase [Erysipelotrichaceae bacterium]|jgi:4-diphosphocytidyl-2C-methyl-D-erythritol kinase|nr:4-(cytidine 5'-diphospho)-2-C-methyl-D-erythritol kinase [Erysipelotrichaceae bacterium]